MSEEDLARVIRRTAERVRKRDFVWSAAIAAGVLIVTEIIGAGTAWWLPVAAWVAFMIALIIRYRFSSGRLWAEPVQRVVENEMSTRAAEIETLQLAYGIAQALPEPIFILDGTGVIEHANPAAHEMVGAQVTVGRHLASVVRAPAVIEAVEAVGEGSVPQTVEYTSTTSVERFFRAFVTRLNDTSDAPRTLVYVRDLTSEKRVDRLRADFIASASHELRTPLASLLGFIETLRGHARDDPESQEKFLKIMQAQGERMQRLIADLMSLSRIELNEHVAPRDQVDLCALTLDLIDGVRPLADEANASISTECIAESLPVIGEADEITQLVQNLVQNAIKYGGDPPRIEVHMGVGEPPAMGADAHSVGDTVTQLAARQGRATDDFAYLMVRDYGPGVARADLVRLTERFYRVDVGGSRRVGGTGLGLAIVKHIVNRHQGALQMQSILGGGTAFICFFRRSGAHQSVL